MRTVAVVKPAVATVVVAFVVATIPARAAPMSTSPEQAYDQGEIPSARAVGMGGALNALGVSTAGLYLNPAALALARVYHFEALAANMPEAARQTYGLSVVDSMTSRVAGGLAGTWSSFDPSGTRRTWTDVRSVAAVPLGDHFSFGTTLRWLRVEQSVNAGPLGASPASGGTASGPIYNGLTFDAGATATVGDAVRLAAVGHNLTFPKTALAPTTAGAGAAYFSDVFSMEIDGTLDFTTWSSTRGRIMVGGELFLADHFALRAGWRFDGGTRLHTPSLGVGYIDTRWGIEIGARRDVDSSRASTFAVLSIRYFYDPNGASQAAPAESLGGF